MTKKIYMVLTLTLIEIFLSTKLWAQSVAYDMDFLRQGSVLREINMAASKGHWLRMVDVARSKLVALGGAVIVAHALVTVWARHHGVQNLDELGALDEAFSALIDSDDPYMHGEAQNYLNSFVEENRRPNEQGVRSRGTRNPNGDFVGEGGENSGTLAGHGGKTATSGGDTDDGGWGWLPWFIGGNGGFFGTGDSGGYGGGIGGGDF